MHQKQDSLSRRLDPVFAEMAEQMAEQAANAQQGPKSGQQGVENLDPLRAPSKADKPANGGGLHGAVALALRGGKPGLAAALAYKPTNGGYPG